MATQKHPHKESPPLIDPQWLPVGSVVYWNNLSETWCHDEDLVYIKLPNGIGIDAGHYGDRDDGFLRVDVVGDVSVWDGIESSLCKTPQEAAGEVVRLARKFASDWHARILNDLARRRREWDDRREWVEVPPPFDLSTLDTAGVFH